MKPTPWAALAFVCAALAPPPVLAHHSFAMFDLQKQVTISGTVKAFQWTNPHSWVQVLVDGPNGQMVEWSLESQSPNVLKRLGWTPTSVKAGDRAVFTLNPLRNGSAGGSLLTVKLESGKALSVPSAGVVAPAYQPPAAR